MKKEWLAHDEFHFPGMINGPQKRGKEAWVSSFTEDGAPLCLQISWAGQQVRGYERKHAFLIASAPDLQASGYQLLHMLENFFGPQWVDRRNDPAIKAMFAALAKSEGEDLWLHDPEGKLNAKE